MAQLRLYGRREALVTLRGQLKSLLCTVFHVTASIIFGVTSFYFWIVITIQIMLHYSPAELARPPVVVGNGAVPVRLALVLLILPRLRGAPEESLECAKL